MAIPAIQTVPDAVKPQTRKFPPTREVVVGGPWGGFIANAGYLLATVIDDVVRQYGPRVYELMVTDDAVASSLGLLKAGALAEGIQVTPREQQNPGEVVSKRKRKTELNLAQEIADHCERSIRGLDRDFDETLFELMDALPFGCQVAELVFDEADSGPDKGKLVLSKVHIKPRWAWAMRVNMFLEVLALRCWTVEGWVDVEREKFAILSWHPKDGDPRGTSILRVPFEAWNGKTATFPDHREYLRHFADPSLILTAGENQQSTFTTDPNTGLETETTPQQANLAAAQAFANRSILSLPFGATARFMESQGNGEAYEKAFDRWDRMIFRSIIWGARPMQEAKHGSKADTDSGMDLVNMAVTAVRKPLARCVEGDIFFRMVERNWSPDVAKRLTPKVSFGITDHMSPELLKAFSDAWFKGLFGPQQRPWLLHKLGAPAEELPDPRNDPNNPQNQRGGGRQPGQPDDVNGQQDQGDGQGGRQDRQGDDQSDNEEATDYGGASK